MGFLRSLMSVISTDGKTGTPFKLDKHTVYWKGKGITELEAAHVAGYFKGYGYFKDDNSIDVQILSPTSSAEELRVNFIVNPQYVTSEIEDHFKSMVSSMHELFPGRKLSSTLVDPHFKEVKNLGYM